MAVLVFNYHSHDLRIIFQKVFADVLEYISNYLSFFQKKKTRTHIHAHPQVGLWLF